MATLNIGGKRVKVDDAFLSLPPEQQQATVEEIAAQIGASVSGSANAPAPPDMYASGNARRISGRATPQNQEDPNLLGAATTLLEHGISDLPVVGPILQGTGDAISTNLQGLLTGQDPKALQAALDERRRKRDATYPLTALSGGVIGNVAGFGGIGATKAGAQALGLTGKFLPRVGNAALSGGAISAADAAVRGNDPLESGIVGAGVNAAFPIVGRAGGEIIKAVGRKAAPIVGAMTDAASEAGRRVGTAYQRDARANPSMLMTGADEVTAKMAGIDPLNVDRGGETVRALARSVANQSPEARAVIEKTASDRFAGQGTRAANFVTKMAGGNVDDVGTVEALQQAARAKNSVAYKAAESDPAARAIWSGQIRKLMQSDIFRSAIKQAESAGSDFAAISGTKAVRNPFVFGDNGSVTLRRLPNGSYALPDLQFWDIVQRNLRKVRETALGANDKTTAGVAKQLRDLLNAELDAKVPAFGQARRGAAAFFGAEDAIEAGKNFASALKMVPEARKAYNKLSVPEQKLFRLGHASSLIDRIKAAGDRSNVINQVFKNPAMREMIELIYGKGNARELEAYIRVEDLVDKLRGAMGNSTTARQLMEMGIGAGTGAFVTGGDWKGALTGAGIARGARYLGGKLDDRVMQEVAKLLLSNNPSDLKKAIYNAAMSEKWMEALDALGTRLEIVARGSTMALAS